MEALLPPDPATLRLTCVEAGPLPPAPHRAGPMRLLSEADTLLAPYVSADGQVVFNTSAHIVTGQAS
jgi:hypothetical protein